MSTVYLVLSITFFALGGIAHAQGLPGLELATLFGLPLLLLWFYRRRYDRREHLAQASRETRVGPYRDLAEAEPMHGNCRTCHAEGTGWNLVRSRLEMGFILFRYSRERRVLRCPSCIRSAVLSDFLLTLVLGWWSLTGPLLTPLALVRQVDLLITGGPAAPTDEMLDLLAEHG